MRHIDAVVVHCSATPPDSDIGVNEIRRQHMSRPRYWSDVGYHYVIRRDGVIEDGRPLRRPGAHVKGHNGHTIGVCLVGGVNADNEPDCNYTAAQWASLQSLVSDLVERFGCQVRGHRDYPGVKKSCPCFDVRSWWDEVDA